MKNSRMHIETKFGKYMQIMEPHSRTNELRIVEGVYLTLKKNIVYSEKYFCWYFILENTVTILLSLSQMR